MSLQHFDGFNCFAYIILLAPEDHCIGLTVMELNIKIIRTDFHITFELVQFNFRVIGIKWLQ